MRLGLIAVLLALATAGPRIVRVTYIKGGVMASEPAAPAVFHAITINFPLAQGITLRTVYNGSTEVQWECGSELRLIPSSTAVFTRLDTLPSGVRASVITLTEGTAFVSMTDTADAAGFELLFPGGELGALTRDARARVDLGAQGVDIHVTAGNAELTSAQGPQLRLDKGAGARIVEGQPVVPLRDHPDDEWARWNHDRDVAFEKQLASAQPTPFNQNPPGPLDQLRVSGACTAPRK